MKLKGRVLAGLTLVAALLVSGAPRQAEARIDCIANATLGERCRDCVFNPFLMEITCQYVSYHAYCGCSGWSSTCYIDTNVDGYCDYSGCTRPICPGHQ